MTANTSSPPKPRPLSAVNDIRLPPHLGVWKDFRMALPEPKFRMSSGVQLACQDPAIVVELLRASSSMAFSDGRPPVTTIKAAIERLGAENAILTLDEMSTIPRIPNEKTRKWFEIFRDKGQRVGLIAKVMCDAKDKNLSDDGQLAGCLVAVGDMLVVHHLDQIYVDLAEKQARAKVLYALEKQYSIDPSKIGVSYLKKVGIPGAIVFALDPEAETKIPSRGILRPIIAAALEMVNGFDNEKWDKFAPGVQLPAKSPIRLLGFSESQYAKLYEQIGEILHNSTLRLDPTKAEAPPKK